MGDQSALIKLFGVNEEYEVTSLFEQFWPPLLALKEAASTFLEAPSNTTRDAFLDKHKGFIDISQDINKRFISMCLARYQNIIENGM